MICFSYGGGMKYFFGMVVIFCFFAANIPAQDPRVDPAFRPQSVPSGIHERFQTVSVPGLRALSCAGATTIQCGDVVAGDTVGLPNTQDVYGGVTGTFSGSEQVYALTLSATTNIDIYLEDHPGRGQYLFLLERGQCNPNLVIEGGVDDIHLDGAIAGTYYLVVDGRSPADNGPYTLRIVCNTPVSPPDCDAFYTVTNPAAYSWYDALGGTLHTLGDNVNTGFLPLPFTFNYYGTDYSSIAICSNGWASFVSDTSFAYFNTTIPGTTDPNAMLAIQWDNLVTDQVYTQTMGTAPNRVFVMEWYQAYPCCNATLPRNTFEIVLFESTNEILFQYSTMASGVSSSTIGIENIDGTSGFQIYYNQAPNLTNSAIKFSPSGITFPDCATASNLYCNTTVAGDTSAAGRSNRVLAYSCGVDTYAGNEQVYLLTLTQPEVIRFDLTDTGSREMDLFVLSSCSQCECLAGGREDVKASLRPGTYTIVVDGFTPADDGPFTLTATCTSCVDPDKHERWIICENPDDPSITPSTTSAFTWYFDDCDYCRDSGNPCFTSPCTFDMYIVAECGAEMHMPLWDNESGDLRIYDMMAEQYVYLYAQSTGGWSAQGYEIAWQDCSGMNPNWNNVTTDIWFYGSPTLCGIYRAEFVNWGGFIWELYSNCTGTSSPGFRIFDNYCEALANYDPYPVLSVESMTISGTCPTYTVDYAISNAGCSPATTTVVVNSDLGGFAEHEEANIQPGETRTGSITFSVQSSGTGTIYAYADLYNEVQECQEAGDTATACSISGGGPVATQSVTCNCVIPQFSDVQLNDVCTGIQLTWSPAVFGSGAGHYDLYRSTVSFEDALLQPPIATLLTATSYLNTGTVFGTTYYYVVKAEDSQAAPPGCSAGPHNGLYTDVNAGPITENVTRPNATASNTGPYCEGETIQLLASPDGMSSYSWTGPNGFTSTDQNPTIPNATLAMAGTYNLTITQYGCTRSAKTEVFIDTAPAVEAGPDEDACLNDPAFALSGQSPAGGVWSGPGVTDGALGIFSPSVAGAGVHVITYAYSAPDGCTISDTKNVTVYSLPEPTITGPAEMCPGESVSLDAGAGYASYLWNPGGQTTRTVTVSPGSTTTYTVTVTDGNGCQGSDTHEVVVHSLPAITAGNTGPYCVGETIQLSGSPDGMTSYAWVGPAGFTSSFQNPSIPNATTARAGTYTLTVETSDGCTGSAQTTVTVHANPTPTITGPTETCEGQSVTLDAGAGYASYLWSPGGQTTRTITVSPGSTTTYSVTVSDSNGCQGSDSHQVVVHALPTASASNTGPYCEGETIQLNGGPAGMASYGWTGPNGFTSALQNPTIPGATTAMAGTYTLTVQTNDGCTDTAQTTVTVYANPTPTITGPTETCEGQSVTLDAGAGYAWYLWSPGGQTTRTITVSPGSTTTYNLTVTDGNGCQGIDTHTVAVLVLPAATASNGGPYCESETIQLNGGPAGMASYNWTGPDGFSSTQQNPAIPGATAAKAGTYTLTVQASNGCFGTAVTTVTVVPSMDIHVLPEGPETLCTGENADLTVRISGGSGRYGLQWTEDGSDLSGEAGEAAWNEGGTGISDNDPVGTTFLLAGFESSPPVGDAFLDFNLAGSANLTSCVRIDLEAPGGAVYTLKNYGESNQSPYDVTTLYNAEGPGDYHVTVFEDSGCGSGTVDIVDLFMGIGSNLSRSYGTPQSHAYSCSVTDRGVVSGCEGEDTTPTEVSWVDITASASNTGPYCESQTIQLSGGPAGMASYSWTGPNGFTSALQNPTIPGATTAMAGTYTLTVQTNDGCTDTAQTTVTVYANPTPTITGPTETCEGQSVTLDAGAGYASYLWSPGGQTTRTITVSPSSTTTFSVTVSDSNGCQGSDGHQVIVHALPTASASNTGPYCENQTIQLNGGPAGMASYSWTGPNGFTSALQNPTIPGATTAMAGTYTLTVQTNDGCTDTAQTTVTVYANPTPTITGPTETCEGQSVTLDAGAGYASYLWSPGGQTTRTITVSPSSTTTFSVTVSDSNGCQGSDGHQVIVHALPTASASNTGPYCENQTIQLNGGPAGMASYSWTGPNGFTSALQNPTIPGATTAMAGTYTLTVQTNDGCTDTAQTTVTVYANPTPTITGPTETCEGQSVTLDAGAGYASYLWSPGGQTTRTITVSPSSTTTFSVTVSDSNGCQGSDGHQVIVHALPTASASNTGPYCENQTIQLNGGPAGMASYSWTGPNGFTSALQNPTIPGATTAMAGTYTLTVQTNDGCTDTAQTTVTVYANPTPTITGPTETCEGQSVTLDAGAGYASYLWSPGGQTTRTITVSPSSTTTFSVTVSDSNGCQGSDSHQVIVHALPTASASNTGPYCESQTIQLNGGPAGMASYSWTGPNGFTSALQNPTIPGATTAMAGTYTLTVQTNDGCTDTAQTTVTVYANPTPTITGPTETCEGQSVTLDAGAGYASYLWSPGGQTTRTITVSPSSTTTFSVTVSDSNGCQGSDSHQVIVHALPTASASNTGPYCESQTIQLNGGPAGMASYSWTGPNGFTSALQNPTIPGATTAMAGTYTLTVETVDGCTDTAQTTVEVNLTATATASNGGPYCEGETIQLNGGPAGMASYGWTGPGGFTSALQNPTIPNATNAMAGTYTLTIQTNDGCTGSEQTTVTVHLNPTPTITGPTETCEGQSVTLDAGAGYASYLWSPGGQTTRTITVSPSSTTTFSVTVSDSNGCQGSDSHQVIVHALPTASASNTGPYCESQTIQLNGGPAGMASYGWTGPGGFTSALQNPTIPNATNAMAGTYTLTVETVDGCTDTAQTTVEVNLTATATASNGGPYCEGETIQLNGGPAGMASYGWTGPNGFTSALQNPTIPGATMAMAGTYTLTIQTNEGCTGSEQTSVTIYPAAVANASNGGPYCEGQTIELTGLPSGMAGYVWSGPDGFSSALQNPTISNATVTMAGAYTLTIQTSDGCVSTAQTEVEVNLTATAAASNGGPYCEGETIQLMGGPNGMASYTWSGPNGYSSLLQNPSILNATTAMTGTYTLTVQTTDGCTGSAQTLVTVVSQPLAEAGPDRSLTCTTLSVTLLGSAGGGSGSFSYNWVPSTGLDNPNLAQPACSQSGTYTLTVTDTVTGCTDSDTVVVSDDTTPPLVTAGPDKVLTCSVTAVILEGGASGGSGSYSYSWAPVIGLSDPASPQPTCNQPGTYTLTVTDNATGCVSSDSMTVTEVTLLPAASFSPLNQTVCVNTEVCWTSTSLYADTYLWNFGTGTDFSSDPNPCFTYTEPGTYTVTLTVTNDCGVDVETGSITIDPVPEASFNYTTQSGTYCVGRAVNFTDTSTNTPISWQWDFGDGATSTLQNPSHTYSIDGSFTVTLIACNVCGCSEPYTREITIIADCNTNCSANSHPIGCEGGTPVEVLGNTSTDTDNYNTSYYACKPDINYGGPNFTYRLNFDPGANFIITLEETVPEPNGYELDLILSSECNPPSCLAWGDTDLGFDDFTPENDRFFLIVDGRDGTSGPYKITVTCLPPDQTGSCSGPSFSGITQALDNDPCGLGGVKVVWPAVVDWGTDKNGDACTGGTFEVLRAPVSSPASEITVGSGLSGIEYVDISAVRDEDYLYRVNAVNSCCAEPTRTGLTDVGTDKINAPPVFTGLVSAIDVDSPTGCAASGIALSWPSADFGDATGSYRILRSLVIEGTNPVVLEESYTGTSYVDTTATPNIMYYYRIEAVNECGIAEDGGGGTVPGIDLAGSPGAREPSPMDQEPAAEPFLLAKSGTDVTFSWEETGVTYNLYRGSLGALRSGYYDHSAISQCNIVGNSITFNVGDGNYYYLITASACAGGGESSYGRDGTSTERPTAADTTGITCP